MSKERLEEIKKYYTEMHESHLESEIFLGSDDVYWLIKQAERVGKLENRNKELEYASKHNGELNEFLQKRNLPPNTLGRHVVDVVMDYVEELEKEIIERDIVRKSRSKLENQTIQQNKRYREALEKIAWKQSNIEDKRVIVKHQVIARKALEDDCIHCNGKGFNGLDYCPQCNQMEEDDDN